MPKEIKELFDDFLNLCRYPTSLSKETIRGYNESFKLLIKIYPNLVLNDLSRVLLVDFFKQLQIRERVVGRGIIKVGIKNSTILTYMSKLKKFTDWLIKSGYLSEGENPFKTIKWPIVRYEDKKYLEKLQIEKILTAISLNIDWANQLIKKRNLALFYVFIYGGLRKGELIQLKLDDINLDKRIITIRPETSKSRRLRRVPIHHKLADALIDYLEERKKKQYSTPYLFISNNKDDRLTPDGLKHLVYQVNKISGVKFHVHRFRHTYAVNLHMRGLSLVTIQQLLGHTDLRMTAKYLRQLPIEVKSNAIETLDISRFIDY